MGLGNWSFPRRHDLPLHLGRTQRLATRLAGRCSVHCTRNTLNQMSAARGRIGYKISGILAVRKGHPNGDSQSDEWDYATGVF